MMFSLNVNSIRDVLKRKGKRAMTVLDLPRYTQDQLGLRALNLSTDLLKGMGQSDLEQIRDNGDKCGCTCLMLSEPGAIALGDAKSSIGDAGIDRMRRVITAANLLGCNAVSMSIKGKDSEQMFEYAIDRMKRIMEIADKIDMNVLIRPCAGITSDPDRVSEIVKVVGGFRIGTNPSFAGAIESGDPAGYLRKLTPYATVVNATTMGFKDPEPDDSADSAMEKAEGLTGLDALAAELEAMCDDSLPPVHIGYDLTPLVASIKAVGFDGTISLDYRGGGDGTLGVMQSRDAIESALMTIADSA